MYNYKHFKPNEYDFSAFAGPKAGERALDFTAIGLDGESVKLSDFFGKLIVLETGSITCPIYASKVKGMNKLAAVFPDVVFVLLYVREAHPGERVSEHNSLEEKLACARRAKSEGREQRTILVDDLEGSAHKKYGSMPNSVYIINPSGRVVFRGDWNNIRRVERILKERNPDSVHRKERFSGRPDFGGGNPFRALATGGRTAIWDFIKAFPAMAAKHIRKP